MKNFILCLFITFFLLIGIADVAFAVPDPANGLVPEPATALLFGFGLLVLAGVNRRKK